MPFKTRAQTIQILPKAPHNSMAALLVACLLAALIHEGNGLSCHTCRNKDGLSCTGNVTKCPSPYDTCVAQYDKTTDGGKVIDSNYQIGCGISKSCKAMYSVKTTSIYTTMATFCCDTDGCSPDNNTSADKNGLKCRACFEPDADSCNTNENMQCTGVENRCLRYAVNTTEGSNTTKLALRGCASEAFCAYGNHTSEILSFTTECTNSGIRPQHGLLLHALTGLLLLKLF